MPTLLPSSESHRSPVMSSKPGPDNQDGSRPSTSEDAVCRSEPDVVEAYEDENPTKSHALADNSTKAAPEDKGACQFAHSDAEVKNLGWNHDDVPRPVVGGIENKELWTMVRRFNKQVFHVRSIDDPPLANLDLNIADWEEFSPEKLRAQLERLYMVIVVSLVSAWNHVARLRSWREWQRTSAFFAVYSIAWLLDLLLPTIVSFTIILILHPPARSICFPPAPVSLINTETGGIQEPPAGVLASDDSVTGAPEKHHGEAVEQEAHSFVTSIATVCSGVRNQPANPLTPISHTTGSLPFAPESYWSSRANDADKDCYQHYRWQAPSR